MRFSDVLIGIVVAFWMQHTNCELNSTSVSNGISVLAIVPANDNQIYILNRKFTFTSGYYHGWILPSNEKIQLNFTLFLPVELTVSFKEPNHFSKLLFFIQSQTTTKE
jgi:hypothetical protein